MGFSVCVQHSAERCTRVLSCQLALLLKYRYNQDIAISEIAEAMFCGMPSLAIFDSAHASHNVAALVATPHEGVPVFLDDLDVGLADTQPSHSHAR